MSKNLKRVQEELNEKEKKIQEKWWNEDMRIKTGAGVPDLPIFLLNANLEKNRGWIYFVMLNLSQDEEKKKVKLLRLFFLMRSLPPGVLKKQFSREFEIWEDLKKRLDEDWKKFSEKKGFYQCYQLERGKKKFRLLFNKFKTKKIKRKEKEKELGWQEWEVLSKASFAYNFHLLGEVICNVISYFGKEKKIKKLSDNEENRFEVKFDIEPNKKPDILITHEEEDKKEIGIEIVEISSSSVRLKGKKKDDELSRLVTNTVERQVFESIKEHKKIKPELIREVINENIEEVKVKKCEEKNGIFSFSLDVSKKINNTDYIIKKLKEKIKEKNDKWKRKGYKDFESTALWTILSASFAIYLYRTDIGYQKITDHEIQKEFIFWFLLKKVSKNLSNTEIKFGYLIITFLNVHYCGEDSFLNKHDPFKKVEKENMKNSSIFFKLFMKNDDIKAIIPNLYIPVKSDKIKNLEEDLKKLEGRFKEKWNFDINLLTCWEIGPSTYNFYAQDLDKNNA